ncbi:gamma-glutamyltranspeptidase [Epidermidibacterium keratini]|uniref:Gamma-glutamyltranspeptidase n=1 Tax=Epidermidibacterium keratini TaxID=1891644 RepID=A0A7L4YL06_9ACTN|nr:gamma-glutamyltransferase [Epidermidibacterium keratini]QHB99518.1 gamma-glutamyltranspeptidase [Epidermidibacterium keratini]
MPTHSAIPTAVAAGHQVTADVGRDVLLAGGSAADAGVAMMLASCVAETVFTGIGGGGFATYYDAKADEVRCVDFFVTIPGLGGTIPQPMVPIEVEFGGHALEYTIGASSAAVPGVPRGTAYLHERWGSLPWREVVQPAVELAHTGVALSRQHRGVLDSIWQCMGAGLGDAIHRNAAGAVLAPGETLRIPGLGRAMEVLRDQGAEPFYEGEVADAMLAALDGGAISERDLAAYDVIETAALAAPFAGTEVYSRGDDLDDLLETLRLLDGRIGEAYDDPTAALRLVAALRATALRTETTNLVVTDAAGDACVITTSLGLGTGVWVPEYGIHPNSMLGEGELIRPGARPGERMGSMMSPAIALDSDGVVVAAGAAGGSRIRSSLVQVLIGVLVGHRDAQQAIDAPRLNPVGDIVRLEPGFAPAVLDALVAEGDRLDHVPEPHAYFGGVSAITRRGAGADGRRGGAVHLL